MLDQRFDPKAHESAIYARWEDAGCFKPSGDTSAEAYSIVIPPPNVTGVLHMGHALNSTLQDILIRFERMRGKNVLWQPGTDHAGIATQMVVERKLAEEGGNESRASLGREAFVERVWDWKESSGGQIVNQLKRLGASCDWSREKFTMGTPGAANDHMVAAVRKVFVQMYEEGLIYRDKRLVNWDPHFQTAISDLEVDNREVKGHFWHFKYPLEGGQTYEYIEKNEDGEVVVKEQRDYISIATTRPETMLGDGAVAVHPDDERYAPLIGKMVHLPLADRLIPVIADEYPDPDFGSGAVKITGAHDFNDYQVAKRHDLPLYSLMDEAGAMMASDIMPDKYVGLDRFDARKAVVEDIDALGLLIEVEDKTVMQPFGDRSKVVIEPMLTDQWFVDAKTLAVPAIEAVKSGATRFVPENWEKTYFNWMENIEPWCISRQLWWGHRIPAWFGPDSAIFVAEDEAAAQAKADAHYGERNVLQQDEDVLDTWFSSGLWPFSTQGWPEETDDLKAYYPGSVLVTAFDIIFFWVARMMMQGIHFMKEVPFKDVYIHALVLDEKGQKMSKSKGNAINPLDLVEDYGADALRFTMAAMAAQGRNVRLAKQRVEGYRNFTTKLWNAARFAEMNEAAFGSEIEPRILNQTVNRWIVGEVYKCTTEVTAALEAYKFNEAAGAAYKFVWSVFCDWYLELIKPQLQGEDEDAKQETRNVLGWALDQALKILHPFIPFVSETLWQQTRETDKFLMLQRWPSAEGWHDPAATEEMEWVLKTISAIRSVRSDVNVPAGAKVPAVLVGANDVSATRLAAHREVLSRLARLETLDLADVAAAGSVKTVVDEATLALAVADFIDPAEEMARLEKQIGKLSGERIGLEKRLGNEAFLAKAPEEVVAEQRMRLTELESTITKLEAARSQLADF